MNRPTNFPKVAPLGFCNKVNLSVNLPHSPFRRLLVAATASISNKVIARLGPGLAALALPIGKAKYRPFMLECQFLNVLSCEGKVRNNYILSGLALKSLVVVVLAPERSAGNVG
jgi:hypothetical protein